MRILSIDTSCDETAVAVTEGRKILSNVLYSQIEAHKQWGGVVPDLAKRAHMEHIDEVFKTALVRARAPLTTIDAVAVTIGPGLAMSLGVGIDFARQLALDHNLPLIPMNHMEGHIYSCFAQNSKGNPSTEIQFPLMALLVSGGHTELVYMKDHCTYQVIGETIDDASGEALDKAARIITGEMVYPGGPVIEKLAEEGNPDFIRFPRPMEFHKNLQFSYSGLKTALMYAVKAMSEDERINRMHDLAASFQEAVFSSVIKKLHLALKQYPVRLLLVGGGVGANAHLRELLRREIASTNSTLDTGVGVQLIFPFLKTLYSDNAAMIGVAASYRYQAGAYLTKKEEIMKVERIPRLHL